ncbi:MAG: DUF3794 domain-containing protein [Christensenellaceae bacterium]|nr:DUF3794 domain-containing protein [Christensenellaceae bacterium]
METKTISTDRCIRITDERAILEGTLSLPYDTADLASVLDISGCAEIISASAENERISISGKARYTVLYMTKDGTIDSFDSECSFDHVIPLPDASADMYVCANARVCETTWRTEGSSIALRSSLSICLTAIFAASCETVVPEKHETYECNISSIETLSCSCKGIKAYANGDIRIPQTLPEVQKILLARAYAEIRTIRKESERIIAEGELSISVIYESKDKNAPLQFFTETLPFGEIVKDTACTEDSMVFAELSVDRITADLAEADSVSISGVISVNTICINKHPQEIISDLYSLENLTEAAYCDLTISYPQIHDCIKKTLRLDTTIPESAPEAARILYVASSPEVIGILYSDQQLTVDGIMHILLIYSTADSGIKSIRLKEPFELQLGRQSDVTFIRAFSEYTTAQGSGRQIDLKTGLSLCLCGDHSDNIRTVSAVATSDFPERRPSGMIVYFADDGECMWDICKKYGIAQNDAIPLDEKDLRRGDRVLLMR